MDSIDKSGTERVKQGQVPLSGREDGRSDRPVQTAAVWGPRVLGIVDDHLVFDSNEPPRKKNHGTGLLDEFLKLADGETGDFLRFGMKWVALKIASTPGPRVKGKILSAEPIQAWRDVALRMSALLRIGAELNRGRKGRAGGWKILGVSAIDADSANKARLQVTSHIRKLVTQAHLQPRLYWKPDEKGGQWQIDLDAVWGSNLLAVLTVQLMIRIADKEGFAICSICHRSYVPKRRPAATKRNYCDDPKCQRDRWKHLKREQRRRKQG